MFLFSSPKSFGEGGPLLPRAAGQGWGSCCANCRASAGVWCESHKALLKKCMFSALSKKQSSAQTAELSQSRHSPPSPLQCFHYVYPWISAGRPHVCPISTSTWACPWPLCAELMFSQFPLPWVFSFFFGFFFFLLIAIQEPRLF